VVVSGTKRIKPAFERRALFSPSIVRVRATYNFLVQFPADERKGRSQLAFGSFVASA